MMNFLPVAEKPFAFAPIRAAGAGLVLFVLAGCATVDQGGAASFATGAAALRVQTHATLDAAMAASRATGIDYLARQERLTEEALVTTPDAAAVKAWDRALGPIESYAKHLAALAAGGNTAAVDKSLAGLAGEFNTTAADLKTQAGVNGSQIGAGVASLFAEAADAILRARGQKEAAAVAAATDPSIRRVLTALADGIGADREAVALRRTVWENWQQELATRKREFAKAEAVEARRPIVARFLAELERRNEEDELLAALHHSLLALADAHTALAQGNALNLGAAVADITSEAQHARALRDQFALALSP